MTPYPPEVPVVEGRLRASVIIPSWNGAELLPPALDSLRAQSFTDFEILVVDNGSEDESIELLRTRYPDVRIVSLPTNLGFAGAVNAGIAAGRGEIVALLNNDAVADPDWLSALVRALDAHPEVGSCASRMLDMADPRRIDSAGDQLGIFPSNYGHGELDGEAFAQPAYVLSGCAGAAAYRRTMLEDLGGFDERFFAYVEDVDLGVRAQLRGYDCLYVPEAVVFHEGARTGDRIPEQKFFLLMRNSLFVFFQYMPPLRRAIWAPIVLARVVSNAVRARQPAAVAFRAIAAALSDWTRIRARRREVRATALLSWKEFRRRLAGPLAHPSFAVPVLSRTGGARRPVCTGLEAALDAASVPDASAEMRVDVVIVNWNGARYLPRTLDALRRSTIHTRVIVVDNASSDDSLAAIAAFPDVEVVALEANVGYAGGANIGLARGRASFALVMNSDVLLEPDYLAILRARLCAAPRVGAAQGKLYQIDTERFVAGGEPERRLLDSAGHHILPSRKVLDRGQGHPDGAVYARECPIFSATGAALFLRRRMLDTLSPDGEFFDSAFFAYKEDIDLCWRARLRGWEILYVPTAVAHHVRSMPGDDLAAWRRLPASARRHSWKNHYLMMVKNDRMRDLPASLLHVLAWEVGRLGYAFVRDPQLLLAYPQLLQQLPGALRERARSLTVARRLGVDMGRWFARPPVATQGRERPSPDESARGGDDR